MIHNPLWAMWDATRQMEHFQECRAFGKRHGLRRRHSPTAYTWAYLLRKRRLIGLHARSRFHVVHSAYKRLYRPPPYLH